MKTTTIVGRALCAAALLSAVMPAAAQQSGNAPAYPTRALRMVMPFPPGGPTDILGRLLASRLTESMGPAHRRRTRRPSP